MQSRIESPNVVTEWNVFHKETGRQVLERRATKRSLLLTAY